MPTLVWRVRPKSGAAAAAAAGARRAAAAASAAAAVPAAAAAPVPDPGASDFAAAAVPDSVQVAPPAVSSKRSAKAAGGKKKKRKINRAESATAATKKSKATSERGLPRGVTKRSSGKFQSKIWCGGKNHNIGSFNTLEQASTAYMSVRKDLDDAKLLASDAGEAGALFDAARIKAIEAVGGTSERDLPRGVRKTPRGKFVSDIGWGDKTRYIGTFDAPEQASAAYASVRKDLEDAKLSAVGADEVDAMFDEAKKKALEAVGGFFTRDLPTGVTKTRSGKKFSAQAQWRGKKLHIGSFDTPEQASAAYKSVWKDLDDAKARALSADEVDATFDAAKRKAVEAVGGLIKEKRDLPRGVRETPSGKFQSDIWCGSKPRCIGTFDTLEQASAAFTSVRKDLDDANLSTLGTDEVDAIFDAAQTKALEAVGGSVPKKRKSKTSSKRDLPQGVRKTSSGKYVSEIWWGDKTRRIGTFDTLDQASAAYTSMSAKKDLADANLSMSGADEAKATFDEAKKKAVAAVGGVAPRKATPVRDLPRGVSKARCGRKFQSRIQWGGKTRNIGTFDTPEQASAAFMSVRKDLDDAKVRPCGSDKVKSAMFDAAKKKALEALATR